MILENGPLLAYEAQQNGIYRACQIFFFFLVLTSYNTICFASIQTKKIKPGQFHAPNDSTAKTPERKYRTVDQDYRLLHDRTHT